MDKDMTNTKLLDAEPKTATEPITNHSLASAIETKRVELLDVKHQLEFQLNGVVNQLHLIDQLLHPEPEPKPEPEPEPEPDNTI